MAKCAFLCTRVHMTSKCAILNKKGGEHLKWSQIWLPIFHCTALPLQMCKKWIKSRILQCALYAQYHVHYTLCVVCVLRDIGPCPLHKYMQLPGSFPTLVLPSSLRQKHQKDTNLRKCKNSQILIQRPLHLQRRFTKMNTLMKI